jgi:outer membrane receptor for ferrienterochelin and colicins
MGTVNRARPIYSGPQLPVMIESPMLNYKGHSLLAWATATPQWPAGRYVTFRFVRAVTRFTLTVAFLTSIFSTNAAAQFVDYRDMEQLFDEPVTTSATGKPQRISDVPVNMEIVTQDDIRRSGATDIPDVLQFVTGVDVRPYGVADAEVGIRGYNQPYNPRLLVMVNGRQVYTDDYGHVAWPTIPVQLSEIRQIEVIKGPNSALYGFNAVSGVINIITYDPLRDNVNTATLTGGTQNYIGGSAVGTGHIGDSAGVRIAIGGFQATDFSPDDLPALSAAARLQPRVGTFDIDGRWRITPGVEAFVEASMGDSRYAEENFAANFDTSFSRSNSLRVGISADTALGLLSVNAYRNQQLLSIASAANGFGGWVNEDVYVVQASDLVKLGTDHTIRVGLEYRNNADTSPAFLNGTMGYADYAVNIMWNWAIVPNLSWTNALRVDALYLTASGIPAIGSGITAADYSHAGFIVPSFNSGLVFQATDIDTLRLMVARGVQAPSLVDFGLQLSAGQAGPFVASGNPDVHPSIVDNIEFDYDRAIPLIGSTLRVALFAQRTQDIIGQPFSTAPAIGSNGVPVFIVNNVGSSDAVGTEIGIKGQANSGFRWNASYSFVTTTNNTLLNQGSVVTSAVDYGHSVPRNILTAGIGYTFEKWEMDLMGRWQSSYLDFRSSGSGLSLEPIEIRNYITVNARIGYRLTENFTLALAAQQFNAPSILRSAGPPVTRRVLGSATVHF